MGFKLVEVFWKYCLLTSPYHCRSHASEK